MGANPDVSNIPAPSLDYSNLGLFKLPGGVSFSPTGQTGLSGIVNGANIISGTVPPTAIVPNSLPYLNVFNVKVYGAIGNGIADDAAAIQLTIANAAASGGAVFFPAGTYLVSSASIAATYTTHLFSMGDAIITGTANPLINATNLSLNNYVSFSLDRMRLQPSAGNTALNMTAVTYASFGAVTRIESCTIVGLVTQNISLVTVKYCANVVFTNTQIFGSSSSAANTGLYLVSASVSLVNCVLQGLTIGVSQVQDGSGNPCQACAYTNSMINACTTGFSSSGSYGWTMTGCEIANCPQGIAIDSDASVSIVGCFFGTSGTAIFIQSTGAHSYPANGIYVAGNFINIYGSSGVQAVVYIYGSSTTQCTFNVSFVDNFINAPGVVPAPLYAIALNYVAGITIRGNQVDFTPGGQAIVLSNLLTTVALLGYTNLFTRVSGNNGINPVGAIAVPIALTTLGSGAFVQNLTGYDCTVYIVSGSVTSVALRGLAGTDTLGTTGGTFRVASGGSIGVNFTGGPVWYWVAE